MWLYLRQFGSKFPNPHPILTHILIIDLQIVGNYDAEVEYEIRVRLAPPYQIHMAFYSK